MKHPLMRALAGLLLILSCSITFAGQATLELTQGSADKLSGYTANGAISAQSAYSADQADPKALSDSESATVDKTESVAVAESPEAMAVWVTIQGTVRNDLGSLVCAMALANGQYMFTCNPLGSYTLTLPLNSNGQIDLQVFAAGHMPFRMKLPGNQGFYGVILEVAEDCSPPAEYCGNGFCGVNETYINCPQDCTAPPPTEWCGNGFCGIGEDYINCPQDCNAPPPATSSITINLIDGCADGRNIDYKYYDTINSLVWPSPTTHWVTPGFNLKSTHTLECQNSGHVCIGARSGTSWWGVDLDGSKSCTDCCLPCENKTWDWTLNCGI